MVQLREKEASAEELAALGARLLALLRPYGVPLLINDRADVAHAIGADGVHIGQSDTSAYEARSLLGPRALIGLSVETMQQAQAANAAPVSYVAASPVFATCTKQDCAPPWGLEGLKTLCAFSRHPVVAIGGIHVENAEQVWACGPAGIAVVSAILRAPCPRTAASQLREGSCAMR
jgi:thiamine-phosphate pyrophosphorylase